VKSKLTSAYLSAFCMEMTLIVQAGIPPVDGVRELLNEADKNGKIVLQSLLAQLEKKAPLSSALHDSGYFPEHMVGVVAAGEKTGRVIEVLKSLGEYYNRLDRLTVTVKNAVFFPFILLAIMVGIVVILITQVLPIFSGVFGSHGERMSSLASTFMRFGQWLSGASAVIAAVFAVILIITAILWIFPKIRARALGVIKKMSTGRGLLTDLASYHFMSVMVISLESGIKTKDAMALASAVSGGTPALDKRNKKCAELIQEGAQLAAAMRECGILSAKEAQLLSFGARGGMTDSTLAQIADRKERYLIDKINSIVGRIEPALVITISVMVGVILLSVMAPLMGIMSSIGG